MDQKRAWMGARQLEAGRTIWELLVIFVVMTILAIFGIMFYRDALNQHEADRVYEEIAVTASSVLNRGTMRTNAGFGDSKWGGGTATRMGKGLALEQGCPMNAFTIKVDGVDQGTCEYLMKRKWPAGLKPRAFYRAANFANLCSGNTLSGGYYMTSDLDCTAAGAPEKGAFAVVFVQNIRTASGGAVGGIGGGAGDQPPVDCQADSDCNAHNACLICNPNTKMCDTGCTEVAYLESNGTQYIDTGINASTQLISEIKVQSSVASKVLLGSGVDSNMDNRYQIFSSSTWYSFRMDGVSQVSNGVRYSDLAVINLNAVTKRATVNGTGYGLGYTGTIADARIGLFGRILTATGEESLASAKIYYCKMWQGSTLVRDFVPVHTSFETNGKHNCMFDKVSKQLFCNTKAGDFAIPAN